MTQDRLLIAVTGGSASGKSRLAHALCAALGGAPLLAEDDYYRCSTRLPDFDPATHNFDEPEAKDHELLASHLAALKAGAEVMRPVYDFTTHSRRSETAAMAPAPVLVVEGLHVLCDVRLTALFDFSVYVDAPEQVRLERRIARDMAERGRTRESVLHQFATRVSPMHEQHVEPARQVADLVVENAGAPDFDALARPVIAGIGALKSQLSPA